LKIKKKLPIYPAVFAIFATTAASQAATYWVSPSGAAPWANAKSQTSLAGTLAGSMAAANSNAAAGDTVYLRGGTYAMGIAPVKSGNSSSRITFKGYAGETARISGTATAINVNNKTFIVIDSVTTDSNKIFADFRRASRVWILNSTLINSTDTGGWPVGVLMYSNSRYNRIANCTIGNAGHMSVNDDIGGLMVIGAWEDSTDSSAYNLIENNVLYHGGHHVMEVSSKYNIIRGNTFHNENWTSCGRSSTGNLCGNRNILVGDIISAYWNVIEGNRFAFSGASIDDQTGASGLSIRCSHTIIRKNLIYLNDGPGMTLYADGSGIYDSRFCHIYNNVYYKNGVSPLSQSDYRYTFGLTFDDVAGNNPAIPITDNAIKNNLFYKNTGGDLYFYYTSLSLQTVLGNYYASASNNSVAMAAIPGNTLASADPLFADISAASTVANIAAFDFHLRTSSPAIDKGVFLTATTAVGSGTVITVADAGYFIDGYGITGGDTVQLEGQTEHAQILSIDYSANKITVDKSLTWSSGQGVALAYSGTAPDIGACEYAANSIVAPPAANSPVQSSAAIRLRGTGFNVTLSGAVRSPELTLYNPAGRAIYRMELNLTSKKNNVKGFAIYDCAWHAAPAAGIYFAVVKESSIEGKSVLTQMKWIVGK